MLTRAVRAFQASAAGAVASSFTIKYLLPYLSENVFRRIGYGAMVVSGLVMLFNTSAGIIRQDRPGLSYLPFADPPELQLVWRNSQVVLEFSWDDGLEIEHRVRPDELPPAVQAWAAGKVVPAGRATYEVVYKAGRRQYEVNVWQQGRLVVYDYGQD